MRGFVILTILFCSLQPAFALQSTKPRPDAGRGLLVMANSHQERTENGWALVIYREPAIARLGEFPVNRLPDLAQVVGAEPDETAVAVRAKRKEWVKIVYDDAGREGWARMERSWRYVPWDTFLKGCTARLLPGLKNGYSLLRSEAGDTSREAGTLPRERDFRIIQVTGDWAQVMAETSSTGWLRWRDADGRFLISVRSTPER
jgi:hypothetical protein